MDKTREHIKIVEADYGNYRQWSQPMPESRVTLYINALREDGFMLSDVDCSVTCWCCSWNQGK